MQFTKYEKLYDPPVQEQDYQNQGCPENFGTSTAEVFVQFPETGIPLFVALFL